VETAEPNEPPVTCGIGELDGCTIDGCTIDGCTIDGCTIDGLFVIG